MWEGKSDSGSILRESSAVRWAFNVRMCAFVGIIMLNETISSYPEPEPFSDCLHCFISDETVW